MGRHWIPASSLAGEAPGTSIATAREQERRAEDRHREDDSPLVGSRRVGLDRGHWGQGLRRGHLLARLGARAVALDADVTDAEALSQTRR